MMASPGIPEVEWVRFRGYLNEIRTTAIKYTMRTALRQGISLLEVCKITQSQQTGTNFGRTDFLFVLSEFDQIVTLSNSFYREPKAL